MSFLQYRERIYEDEVKTDSGRSSSAIRRTRLVNGRAVSVLGQARLFAELDWSSSSNDRAESVLGPARPFTELDWSSSANDRAESVLGPTRRTAELNPQLFQLGERPS
ncbi:hypothetical protein F2Q69_00029964 [Brassica cretica]|uniref:Uncharacterized protein n=1 Tax=Brassica cretica TaxID=69181 RepID=A0A8S9S8K9_BRACR|nr:hypothetical protein F2Q69_00029964 [Brassica cretica]